MSNLTEAQRQRMEENRRKALERRALIQKQKLGTADSSSTSHPMSSSVMQESISLNKNLASYSNLPDSSCQNEYPSENSLKERPDSFCPAQNHINFDIGAKNILPVKSFYSAESNDNKLKISSSASLSGASSSRVQQSKKLNGTFSLLSEDRFFVDAPYHASLIQVFKSIPSRQYDPLTRQWNFKLDDHDKLVSSLQPLRPDICISPLPQFVQNALKISYHYPSLSGIDLTHLDPILVEALLPFQREGVCFGISRGGHVLIADDMGLGKTIQAMGIAAYYMLEWPLLVVTPCSVRYSWADSFDRWVPSVDSEDICVINSSQDEIRSFQVVIISYDLLTRRAKDFQQLNFQVVILDESHMIKNCKTARFKALQPIIKKAKRLVLLSGTPALSRPSELYTQISAVNRSIFPRFQEYGIRYCAGQQNIWGWDFSGSSNLGELEIILKSCVMIRRTKASVISQLPSKQRTSIILDPSQVSAGTKAMEEAAHQLGLTTLKGSEKHGALLRFFAETARAKLKAVSAYIKDLLESDKKFIVFAHHKVMMDRLCSTCDESKIKYIRIDGATVGEARQRLVDMYQINDDIKVAVLSITAAGTGISLTAAHLVVFAELFWNPGVLVQAEDRSHRIGQEDCVIVQYLVARGTADDFIWPIIYKKFDVLSRAGLSSSNFSDTNSICQKNTQQQSILDYFSKLDLDDFCDSLIEPPFKKVKNNAE